MSTSNNSTRILFQKLLVIERGQKQEKQQSKQILKNLKILNLQFRRFQTSFDHFRIQIQNKFNGLQKRLQTIQSLPQQIFAQDNQAQKQISEPQLIKEQYSSQIFEKTNSFDGGNNIINGKYPKAESPKEQRETSRDATVNTDHKRHYSKQEKIEIVKEICEKKANGYQRVNITHLARQLQVHRKTVQRWVRNFKVPIVSIDQDKFSVQVDQ